MEGPNAVPRGSHPDHRGLVARVAPVLEVPDHGFQDEGHSAAGVPQPPGHNAVPDNVVALSMLGISANTFVDEVAHLCFASDAALVFQ